MNNLLRSGFRLFQQYLWVQFVLDTEIIGNLDILSPRLVLGAASNLVPGLPLGLGFKAEHAGLIGLVVPLCALLVPAIEQQ